MQTKQVDVLVYVALREEFEDACGELGIDLRAKQLPGVALTTYEGEIPRTQDGEAVSVAIIPAGKMGSTSSASIIASVLGYYDARNVVVLGIAGSVSDDLQPGDVFIPQNVHEYLANSGSSGDGEDWTLRLSGNRFNTDPRLLNRFQNFGGLYHDEFAAWQLRGQELSRTVDVPIRQQIEAEHFKVSLPSRLMAGDDRILASGPTVSKGMAFARWLKGNVRKAAAMEMESAGVHEAAEMHTRGIRTIAIRGISDCGDERKTRFEEVSGGKFRKLAVRSATALLYQAIRAGLFASEEALGVEMGLTRFGGRFSYAAFFTECISSNSIGLL